MHISPESISALCNAILDVKSSSRIRNLVAMSIFHDDKHYSRNPTKEEEKEHKKMKK